MRQSFAVEELLNRSSVVYPGWRVRIYHNLTSAQPQQSGFLCSLYCSHPQLDLCDVRAVPELSATADLENRGLHLGRAWRFAVLGDPTVRQTAQLSACNEISLVKHVASCNSTKSCQ